MKRRILSGLLALALLLTVTPVLAVQALDSSVQVDKIVGAAVDFFTNYEGDYGSVHANDSGAASIGKLQWHGVRALRLLRRIANLNPTQAKELLGDTLYNEVMTASESSWKTRKFSSSEAARVASLLVTPEGKQAQDDTAYEDISGYINHGYDQGIRTDEALLYYCDIENQYGSGNGPAVVRAAKAVLGKDTITSLDEFHNALLNSSSSLVQNYISRRKKTYNFIKQLNWNDYNEQVPGEGLYDMPAKDSWMYEGVAFVLEQGLFTGVDEHHFAPDMSMTRAMMVTVLYRFSGMPEVDGENPFTDVPADCWYTDAVIWATGEGIVSGVGNDLFKPNDVVTREQIATFLYRLAQMVEPITTQWSLDDFYPDAGTVSDYAVTPLCWANENGLVSGEKNQGVTMLNPLGVASRAQVASILLRFACLYCQ